MVARFTLAMRFYRAACTAQTYIQIRLNKRDRYGLIFFIGSEMSNVVVCVWPSLCKIL